MIAKRASVPAIGATQFSIFMAVLNLGASSGAKVFASVQPLFGYEGVFIPAAIFARLAALLFRGEAGHFNLAGRAAAARGRP